ncbi:MAG: sugar porter family MFS transporter [Pseudomonadota bacterium]
METTNTSEHNKQFLYFIATIAAIGGLLFGFDTGVISGALIFIKDQFQPGTWWLEFVVSSTVLGAGLGALVSGHIADRFGRRRIIIIAALAFIIGTALAAVANSIGMIIVGRFVLGVAIGIASYASPLFISEVSPAHKRGAMVLLNGIGITGGQVFSFLIDYLLADWHAWRLMIAIGLIPAFVLLIGMFFAPNSPRWLMLAGYSDQAKKVLKKICASEHVEEGIQQIEESIRTEKKHRFSEIFHKRFRPVLIIGLGLGIFQQLMGINTVMYYGPSIFGQIGFAGDKAQILGTFGLGVVNMLVTIFTLMTVDKWGRRKLLLSGTFIAFISLMSIAWLNKTPPNTTTEILSVFFLISYITGYSMSIGSLFWLIIAEIFPLSIRGQAMGFVAGIQWGANFVVSSTFLSLLHAVGGSQTFLIYALMTFCACFFCYKMVPETKDVSLETIEHNLSTGTKARYLGSHPGNVSQF